MRFFFFFFFFSIAWRILMGELDDYNYIGENLMTTTT
jgi:hypothetical protein